MPEVSKEAEVTGWLWQWATHAGRVQAPPHTWQTLLPSLVLSADSLALLPWGTPPPLPHPLPCFVFLRTLTASPHPILPYFIVCLFPLEGKVHDGKDFFFFFNLLVHPHHLEQSQAPSMRSDHICLMSEFFVENESLKISHFPKREVIRIYPSLREWAWLWTSDLFSCVHTSDKEDAADRIWEEGSSACWQGSADDIINCPSRNWPPRRLPEMDHLTLLLAILYVYTGNNNVFI